jgi:phage shock protein E
MQTTDTNAPIEPLYVDVRSPGEFAGGHVDGALNIPLDQLARRIDELGTDRSREIVLYCASGGRSAMACGLLHQLGFERVRNGGGIGALAMTCGRTIRRL